MTMSSTVLATAAAAARVALAEAVVLKVGQVLQAIVAATDSDGVTTLTLGDQAVETQLPQPLPPGTTLQLQVKASGATPQLVIVGQSPPVGPGPVPTAIPRAITVAAMPLPQAAAPLILDLQPAPANMPEVLETPAPAVAPSADAVSPAVPSSSAIVESPQTVAAPSSQGASVAATALLLSTGPTEAASGPDGVPLAAATVAATATTATAAPSEIALAQPDGLLPVSAANVPPAQVPRLPTPVVAEQVEQASVGTSGAGLPTELPVSAGSAVLSEPVSQPAPLGASVVMASAVGQAEAVEAPAGVMPTQAVPPAPPSPAMGSAADAAPEPEAANPLLLAQSAARPVIAAEVPQAFVAPPAVAVGAGGVAPLPQTPEAALAQMVPEAIARQASAGPLLQTLADAVQRPNALPEPVLRAAAVVLAQRIVTADGRVSAQAIEQAVTRSGIGLEASLARGAPQAMDAKAGLLALRDALGKWLGDSPAAAAPQPRVQNDAPPLRGLPLRALAADIPPLPDTPHDIGRLLHQETDGAVSRVKLMQLASLPDATGSPSRVSSPTLRLELPFLIGHELVMAQMQIGRDGNGRRGASGKRGWTMRFALNYSATGEVGAEVGLLGKAVTVSLWAAEPRTAAAMRETLPELAGALEAAGLTPQGIRVRGGGPQPEALAAGQLLDSVS